MVLWDSNGVFSWDWWQGFLTGFKMTSASNMMKIGIATLQCYHHGDCWEILQLATCENMWKSSNLDLNGDSPANHSWWPQTWIRVKRTITSKSYFHSIPQIVNQPWFTIRFT
jgi:hypothetical protein